MPFHDNAVGADDGWTDCRSNCEGRPKEIVTPRPVGDPAYMGMSRRKFITVKFDERNQRLFIHVNGWKPTIYMTYMSQYFRLSRG